MLDLTPMMEPSMPIHPFEPPRGHLEQLKIDSKALRGNLLGDPTERTVAVYLPEGYDEGKRSYPLLVGLAGFTGSGLKLLSWQSFGENLPQKRRFSTSPSSVQNDEFRLHTGKSPY